MSVQTVDALEENMVDLCRIMVTGEPVLVLGPGCQRIGYDDHNDPSWRELRRRMRLLHAAVSPLEHPFLEQLWRSKLSDTTLLEHGGDTGLPDEQALAPLDAEDEESARVTDDLRIRGLAVPLLRTLIACTRYLGQVIEAGNTPVLSWQTVTHPRADAIDRTPAQESFDEMVSVATALRTWTSNKLAGPVLADFGFDAKGRPSEALAKELPPFLRLLEIKAVAASSEEFSHRILGGTEHTLSGANIEWLADLLWHTIACDSGVAPSQSELAFCVNLRDRGPWRERLFTRARPGEYRDSQEPQSGKRHAKVTERIRRRTEACRLHGLESPSQWDGDHDRLRVNRTLAATLVQMWRSEPRNATPIALVASHDLMIERQLYELLDAGQGEVFHVVVPVWVSDSELSPKTLSWLWGTYTKRPPAKNPDLAALRSAAGGLLRWEWYRGDLDEDDGREIRGPVIVRVGGSPLLDLGDDATAESLGLGPRLQRTNAKQERVELATIFSEFDALAAMITFASDHQAEKGLAANVMTALAWERRSWAFFADSFPDWIPRVRLLFNARTVLAERGASSRNGKKHGTARIRDKIALDLAFDWPEQAMLEALSVRPLHGDLRMLVQYPHSPDARSEEDWRPFLEGVAAMQSINGSHDDDEEN